MVQPVASAGATLHMIWLSGQFQGVMKLQTPIGSFTIIVVPRSSSNLKSLRMLIAVARWPMPIGTCARCARLAGAPISSVTAVARSPKRFWYSARMRFSTSMRSSRVVCDQVANAFRAAFTALSTSAAEPSEILPATFSVAGLMTSSVLGSTGSTH